MMGGAQEGIMAETRGVRKSAQGNLGGYLVGSQDNAEREGHTVEDRSGFIGGSGQEDGYADTDIGYAQVGGVPRAVEVIVVGM